MRATWLVLVALLSGVGASAAPEPAVGRTFVLAVGVSKYNNDNQWSDLPEATGDLRAFVRAVHAAGVPEDQIRQLRLDHPDRAIEKDEKKWPTPNKINIMTSLKAILSQEGLTERDCVIFYFAGHGWLNEETNETFLLPPEADVELLEESALPVSRLFKMFKDSPARGLFILDSCKNDPRAKNSKIPLGRGMQVWPPGATARTAAFYACQPGRRAHEVPGKGGLFSTALSGTVLAFADEQLPSIGLNQLALKVIAEVRKRAKDAGVSQEPVLEPGNASFMVIHRTGKLTIRCEPKNAELYVKTADDPLGTLVGTADNRLTMPPGKYHFVAKLAPDYLPLDLGEVEVPLNSAEYPAPPKPPLKLTLAPAKVHVETSPAGASLVVTRLPGPAVAAAVAEPPVATPCDLVLAPGDYRFVVSYADARLLAPAPVERTLKGRDELTIAFPAAGQLNGRVALSSTPPGAGVFLDETRLGQADGEAVELPAGTQRLTVRLAGYEDVQVPVEIKAGTTLRPPALVLVPLPLRVKVASEPTGARLTVDGAAHGQPTDCALSLLPGRHTLRAELPGRVAEQVLTLVAGVAPSPVLLKLPEPRPERLLVTSTPTGASVFRGGEPVGTTPVDLRLTVGAHTLRLSRAGYVEREVPVTIEPGVAPAPLAVTLEAKLARLRLSAVPANGAVLTLNGQRQTGALPLLAELPAGPVRVRAELVGHRTIERELTLEPGGEATLELAFQPVPAVVTLASQPAGARVLVDGTARGVTPARLELLPGAHKLELTLFDYSPVTREVTVQAGEELALGELPLALLPGRLQVTGVPAGASLTIAPLGAPPTGRTPLTDEVPPGTYVVRAELPGCRPVEQVVRLSPGRALPLELELNSDKVPVNWPKGAPQLAEYKDKTRVRASDTMPQVLVGGVWYDLHPVTVDQFWQYCVATRRRMPDQPKESKGAWPVVNVTWDDANGYANWAGKAKLPTAEQWSKLALAGGGDPLPAVPSRGKAPVCSRRPNAAGVCDLDNGLREWCGDKLKDTMVMEYLMNELGIPMPVPQYFANPLRVLIGEDPAHPTVTQTDWQVSWSPYTGFRCVGGN